MTLRAALALATLLFFSAAADAQVQDGRILPKRPGNWTYERRGSSDGLYGAILVGKGAKIITEEVGSRFTQTDYEREASRREVLEDGFASFRRSDSWRWASVTKQVVAVLIMQEVAKGRIELDKPIARYLPDFAGSTGSKITVRQLLRHQSGLPNPDDTPAGKGNVAAYYLPGWPGNRDPMTGYCAGPAKAPPGGSWSYNNCDYIVAGALLEAVSGQSWATLVEERIARPLRLKTLKAIPSRTTNVQGYIGADPEPQIDFAAFGASGGLFGTLRDLFAFDRALLTGKLLPPAQLAEMWDGQPQLGFIALGQWVFTVPLKGCANPVKIVERRGAIGGVEARNFILPDKDIVAIAFTNRAGFEFGEVWQGKGFSYNLLSKAACV